MKASKKKIGCASCGRRDFLYGLFAATAAVQANAHEFKDFLAVLPAPTPAGAIPDKTGARSCSRTASRRASC